MLTVEIAVLFPAFLLLLLGGVQAAVWYHARSLCLAAAEVAATTARSTGSTATAGQTAATTFLAPAAGSGSLTDIVVSTTGSTTTTVRVQVTGTVPRVLPIPGLRMRVSQAATIPREVFTVKGDGFGITEGRVAVNSWWGGS